MLTPFDKAIVALLIPLILFGLGHFGLKVDDTFTAALTTVLTPIIVWLVPNK